MLKTISKLEFKDNAQKSEYILSIKKELNKNLQLFLTDEDKNFLCNRPINTLNFCVKEEKKENIHTDSLKQKFESSTIENNELDTKNLIKNDDFKIFNRGEKEKEKEDINSTFSNNFLSTSEQEPSQTLSNLNENIDSIQNLKNKAVSVLTDMRTSPTKEAIQDYVAKDTTVQNVLSGNNEIQKNLLAATQSAETAVENICEILQKPETYLVGVIVGATLYTMCKNYFYIPSAIFSSVQSVLTSATTSEAVSTVTSAVIEPVLPAVTNQIHNLNEITFENVGTFFGP